MAKNRPSIHLVHNSNESIKAIKEHILVMANKITTPADIRRYRRKMNQRAYSAGIYDAKHGSYNNHYEEGTESWKHYDQAFQSEKRAILKPIMQASKRPRSLTFISSVKKTVRGLLTRFTSVFTKN